MCRPFLYVHGFPEFRTHEYTTSGNSLRGVVRVSEGGTCLLTGIDEGVGGLYITICLHAQ